MEVELATQAKVAASKDEALAATSKELEVLMGELLARDMVIADVKA